MTEDTLQRLIESGDVEGVNDLLTSRPELATQTVHWRGNESDPLHYVADCVSNSGLSNGRDDELASVLLRHGAQINGSSGRESPLVAAASLGAEKVARVLIEAGADLEATSIFGAKALHCAAWLGLTSTVDLLVRHGSAIETKCTKFGATPLFWAVQGFSRRGPKEKRDQIGAAKVLIEAGANVQTKNKDGESALERAKESDSAAMHDLILEDD